jgi:Tfp pilus assembly protein PilF
MRLLAGLVIALCLAPAAALAQGAPLRDQAPRDQAPGNPAPQQPAPAPQTLSGLYDRLKTAQTAEEAQTYVRQIARRWGRSGSDSSDLLMSRARQALQAQNASLAVELIDRIIAIQPEWAEAWHVRGLAFFVLQDDTRALADFRQTLRLEPNHFMALGLTATSLMRQGDEKAALRAYRAVKTLHPFFRGADEAIKRLEPKVDGVDL